MAKGRCDETDKTRLTQQPETTGFSSHGTAALLSPVLVSVPHAGREYPDIVFSALRVPRPALLRLEDRYADLLVRGLLRSEQPVIVAHRARAWIDLNRDERDLDVEMVSGANRANFAQPGSKQRGGLGLIPRRLSGDGDLWNCRFELKDVEHRISSFHRPYHVEIASVLRKMQAKFGVAILLDLHSMPPLRPMNAVAPPQFVIGDRFGQSAGSQYSELLVDQIGLRGFSPALNHPYAGDYILRRHARRHANIHAIQLEIDRSLYLDSAMREPGPGLAQISSLVGDLAHALADQALGRSTLIAAE